MTVRKYNSALLATVVVNKFEIEIQQQAIKQAVYDIELCTQVVDTAKLNIRDPLVKLIVLQNQFTLVAYLVYYHYDTFGMGGILLRIKYFLVTQMIMLNRRLVVGGMLIEVSRDIILHAGCNMNWFLEN